MNLTQKTWPLVALVVVSLAGVAVAYSMRDDAGPSVSPTPIVQEPTPQPEPGTGGGGCVVGGCSGELCTDAGDEPAISTCLYRAEFACYASAVCERQVGGACGWTETTALSACLESPPATE